MAQLQAGFFSCSSYEIANAIPSDSVDPTVGFAGSITERKVDHPGPTSNVTPIDEPPIPRVFTVVTVVTQDEQAIRGHDQGSPVISGGGVSPVGTPGDQVVRLPSHGGMNRVPSPVQMSNVDLIQGLAVPDQHLVLHLQCVPGHAHHPLHVGLVSVMGRRKDNDISMPWLPDRREAGLGPGDLRPVEGFVDEEKVPDKEGPLHGGRRDRESLEEKAPNKKK